MSGDAPTDTAAYANVANGGSLCGEGHGHFVGAIYSPQVVCR